MTASRRASLSRLNWWANVHYGAFVITYKVPASPLPLPSVILFPLSSLHPSLSPLTLVSLCFSSPFPSTCTSSLSHPSVRVSLHLLNFFPNLSNIFSLSPICVRLRSLHSFFFFPSPISLHLSFLYMVRPSFICFPYSSSLTASLTLKGQKQRWQ